MVKPSNGMAPDEKPPRLVTLYVPAAFGIFVSIGTPSYSAGGMSLLEYAGVALGVFIFSWPFIMAGFHGYRFIRSFFRRV